MCPLRVLLLVIVCCFCAALVCPGCGKEEATSGGTETGRKEAGAEESKPDRGYLETLTKTYKEGREDPHLLSVRNGLRQFKAMEGRWPESLEEFTEWRGARLPDLPEGRRFDYDPETGELKIVDAETK